MARFVQIDALYPGIQRGLTAGISAARGLGRLADPVCSAIVASGHGRVTDFSEVPEDTVRAQLEQLRETVGISAMLLGVLAQHSTAETVLRVADRCDGPVVLDLAISGPHAETVLSRRGVDVVRDRLGVPDVLLLKATDAELLSEGEITSLDDAQVAAQRIVRRGARAVLIKCGTLPARHFEVGGDGETVDSGRYAADLFYDGSDFALFEAPWIENAPSDGARQVHAVALLHALMQQQQLIEALQFAKRHVTESLRQAEPVGGEVSPRYFLPTPSDSSEHG